MAKREKLSAKQELYLDTLFSDEHYADRAYAKEVAGYAPTTTSYNIESLLTEEILERSQKCLAHNAPDSVGKIVGVMNNPTQKGASTVLAAAKDLLDRGGLVRKERIEHTVGPESAMLILPTKNED